MVIGFDWKNGDVVYYFTIRKPGKVEDWNNGMTKTKNRGQVSTFNKRDDGMMA